MDVFKKGTYTDLSTPEWQNEWKREGEVSCCGESSSGRRETPSYDILNVVRRNSNVGSAMGRGDHFLFVGTASWCVEEHSATSFYSNTSYRWSVDCRLDQIHVFVPKSRGTSENVRQVHSRVKTRERVSISARMSVAAYPLHNEDAFENIDWLIYSRWRVWINLPVEFLWLKSIQLKRNFCFQIRWS